MDKSSLISAHKRIKPFVHQTPVMQSTQINNLTGGDIYFKCENFQRMGAFKMRAASNAIMCLSEEERSKGVVTHSSGNFAQAVALAAKLTGTHAHIVMPNNAPIVKKNAVIGYGAKISECEPTIKAREHAAKQIQEHTGASYLHPSNQIEVIIGNATAAIELIEEVKDLDAIICPVGGGGLLGGTCLAAKHFAEQCKVYGAEPKEVDDAYRSLISGQIETNTSTNTIADGLRTTLGDINFPIIKEHVDSILLVEEAEIINAMKLLWERMKLVVEPSGAVPLAGLIANKKLFEGKKVGIIISGGNVDLRKLPFGE